MKKKVLIVLAFVLLLGSTAVADQIAKEIRVVLPHITFYFDGVKDLAHQAGTFFNGKAEVPLAFNYEGTTYVPLRYVGEKLGKEVGYDPANGTIWVGERPKELATPSAQKTATPSAKTGIYGIYVGQKEQEVSSLLGTPGHKELSALKYEWWVYNKDIQRYIQVGVKDGKVVDLYSNASTWDFAGLKVGSEKSVVLSRYPNREVNFSYDGASFTVKNDKEDRWLAVKDGVAIIFYFDLHQSNRLTAIRQLSLDTLVKSVIFPYTYRYYTEPDIAPPVLTATEQEQVDRGNERIIFDLANVARARFGLPLLTWNEEAAKVARAHSLDMWQNHFFDHVSPTTGLTPAERMEQAAIAYRMTGENIAKGYFDAIEAHEGWMNSLGHRENLLDKDYTTLGVGVKEDLYTQEFVTYR